MSMGSEDRRHGRVRGVLDGSDDGRSGPLDHRLGVDLPGSFVVLHQLVGAGLRVIDVHAEVRRRLRQLVQLVDEALGPTRENAAVRQHRGRAVATNGRRCTVPRNGLGEHRVDRLLLVEGGGVVGVACVNLDQRSGMVGLLAVGGDGHEHVGDVGLDALNQRVRRLAVLTADRRHLRAVGVRGKELRIVDVLEVLPAGETDAPVLHRKRVDRVRQVLRAELAIRVTTGDRDEGELRDFTAVVVLVGASPHLGVSLVGHEGDLVAGDPRRLDVVVVAESELVDLELAVVPGLQTGPVQVVRVAAVLLHRKHDLRALEVQVEAGDVRGLEVRDDVLGVARGQIEDLEAPARNEAVVVQDLPFAVRDVHVVGAVLVHRGRLPHCVDELLHILDCGALGLLALVAGAARRGQTESYQEGESESAN